ncbi:hypothetical protein OpiT1DRAFT_01989 [Opitutaceae bacterium TAV1]|nr:hypothetical protein OpiT1DRAFT_01989 [Opitutaceae bacterium TAV1]
MKMNIAQTNPCRASLRLFTKTTPLAALLTLAVAIPAVSVRADTQPETLLLTENWSGYSSQGTIHNQNTSDGNATWAVSGTGTAFSVTALASGWQGAPISANRGYAQIGANGATSAGAIAAVKLNFDLKAYSNLRIDINFIQVRGSGSDTPYGGMFYLGARLTDVSSLKNVYQFSYIDNGHVAISYIDAEGIVTDINIFTSGDGSNNNSNYIQNCSLFVTENTQQLYIGGVVYDAIARPTQSIAGSAAQYLGFAEVAPNQNTNARLSAFTITDITPIPEASTAGFVILAGAGGLLLSAYNRRCCRQ